MDLLSVNRTFETFLQSTVVDTSEERERVLFYRKEGSVISFHQGFRLSGLNSGEDRI